MDLSKNSINIYILKNYQKKNMKAVIFATGKTLVKGVHS